MINWKQTKTYKFFTKSTLAMIELDVFAYK